MMYVRGGIVYESANLLSKAVVIAIRYSAVRRQSERKPGWEFYLCDFINLIVCLWSYFVKPSVFLLIQVTELLT